MSLTGDSNFRAGFGPLLPDCTSIPFNDLAALEQRYVSVTPLRLDRTDEVFAEALTKTLK